MLSAAADQECYSIEEVLGGLRGGAWGVIGQGRDPGGKMTYIHIKIDRAWGHLPSKQIEDSFVTYIHIKTDRAWPLGRVTSQQNRSRTALLRHFFIEQTRCFLPMSGAEGVAPGM